MLRKLFIVVAIVALLSVVLFDGLVHAVIPHSHDNDAVWQELHIVVQGAYKTIAVSAWLLILAVLLFRIQAVRESQYVISVPQYISRGIAKHRRFG